MLHNFLQGLTTLGSGEAIAYLLVGSLLGVFIGVIPGLSGSVVLAVILSFVFHIDLTGTLCLFLGAHAGSYFSASITSILLNTPAHPEAFAVTFDGYPMAQRGEAGRALGLSAASTCVGGLVGCGVLVGFIQIIGNLANLFHPPEFVALVLLAVVLVGTLGSDSIAKPLISAGLGLMVAGIGSSVITGQPRFTFDNTNLLSGVSLVAVALGAFAIPQMVMVFGTGTTASKQDMTGKVVETSVQVNLERGFGRQVIGGVAEAFRHPFILLQSGLVGALVGIVPGIGGFAGNFMSYGFAQQTARKNRHLFGTGIAEGIIAPEGSSLAKEAGSMVPIIGLGIPGGVGGSLFIAALTIKGIQTGYGFSDAHPVLPYEIVWIIALSGIVGTIAGVLIAPALARVTRVPGPVLVPFILVLSVVGAFLAEGQFYSIYEVVAFGFVGLIIRRLRYSLASFVIGFVLAPTLEANVYLVHKVYPGFSFLTARPGADAIFALMILVLAVRLIQIIRQSRKARRAHEEELAYIEDRTARLQELKRRERSSATYPALNAIMTVAALAFSIAYVIYATRYDLATKLLPIIAGLLVAIPSALQLPSDIRRYVLYRQAKKTPVGPEGRDPDPDELERLSARGSAVSLVGRPRGSGGAGESSTVMEADGDTLLAADPVMAVEHAPADETAIRLDSWGRSGQFTRELVAFAWLLALVVACYYFGFVWGVPAFCLAYGLTCTRRFIPTWTGRITFAVGSAALMWLVAYEGLKFSHLLYIPRIHLLGS